MGKGRSIKDIEGLTSPILRKSVLRPPPPAPEPAPGPVAPVVVTGSTALPPPNVVPRS